MTAKPSEINESTPWTQMTWGGEIAGGGTAALVNTGEWRTVTPRFLAEKCRQCMLCVPFCPDSAIPVSGGKRGEFDLMHCKGCGICAKVCPFGAIAFGEEEPI